MSPGAPGRRGEIASGYCWRSARGRPVRSIDQGKAERTQIQIAALADLDKTTMVSTVDELEKRGLAERRPAVTDRRARIIAVTDKGRLAAEEGQRIVDRVHAEALDALTGDRAAFVEALGVLAETPKDPGPQHVRRARGR